MRGPQAQPVGSSIAFGAQGSLSAICIRCLAANQQRAILWAKWAGSAWYSSRIGSEREPRLKPLLCLRLATCTLHPISLAQLFNSHRGQRAFPAWLATAVEDGVSVGNSTVFGFESYVRWRVLSEALSDGRAPAERAKLQQCFSDRLGHALLQGPLAGVVSGRRLAGTPRPERALRQAVGDCDALLQLMKQRGLFTRAQLQLTLGSGTDLFDESDWQAGGSTSWQYIISGSAVVGASQLAQDRTAATGLGAGLYPGQLLTAPLAAYLSEANIVSRIDEYFLDNRVGRPDPRTFSDPRYYSDVLLEVVALEEGRM